MGFGSAFREFGFQVLDPLLIPHDVVECGFSLRVVLVDQSLGIFFLAAAKCSLAYASR